MIGICYSLLIHCVAERPGRAHMLRASKRIAPLWLQCLHGSASLRHPRSILKPWPPEMSLNAGSVFRRQLPPQWMCSFKVAGGRRCHPLLSQGASPATLCWRSRPIPQVLSNTMYFGMLLVTKPSAPSSGLDSAGALPVRQDFHPSRASQRCGPGSRG